MGVIWSFVRRSLAQNKTRTAVTIIGVVLSTALLMAVFTTVTSMQGAIIESVAQTEGTWQAFDSDAEEGWRSAVEAERHITTVLKAGDHCMANLATTETPGKEGYGRQILAVRTLPEVVKGSDEDAYALTAQPTLTEGRLPENENELMIPQSLVGLHVDDSCDDAASWEGELALGSTIELTASERVTPSGTAVSSYYYLGQYLSDDDWAVLGEADAEETLRGYEERSFTVVGVYEDQYTKISEAGGSDSCVVAFTSANAGFTKEAVWLSTEGLANRDEFYETLDPIFGKDDYYVHNSILNYEGLTSASEIWRSLWTIAGVLAATIMIAAVSLIYNSFAISVTERTRQFGLLSSLGASKRQLGWSVLLEALAIGVIGIPIGILLGIAGVAATLTVSAEALGDLLGAYNSSGAAVAVHVSPLVTAIAIGLSLLTLLISALVPALRAGRVSATDAIRQTQDVHLDRATERKLKRAGDEGKLVLGATNLRERLGGIGGLLAERNLRRAGSRGRVVVASLAVSVLLLVTSGAIAEALNTITSRYETTYGTHASDAVFTAYGEGVAGDEFADAAFELQGKLNEIDGIEPVLVSLYANEYMSLSAGMVSDEMIASGIYQGVAGEKGGVLEDGSYVDWGFVILADDATWAELLESCGVGEDDLGEGLSALAVNRFASYDDDSRYQELVPFAQTGQATLYGNLDANEIFGSDVPTNSYLVLFKDKEGEVQAGLVQYDASGSETLVESIPLSELDCEKTKLDVVGLLDEVPGDLANLNNMQSFPVLVMSLSEARAAGVPITYGGASLTYNFTEGSGSTEIDTAIEEVLSEPIDGIGGTTYSNMKELLETTRRIFDMVYLFVFLFSLITMLIAVANVFNTLSNNIILRTREFAVLKSCGMDNRAFGRMLLSECASYAVRGLVIGLALATLATWAIWRGMSESFAERPFELPWAYVGAAVAGVVLVLAISVVYALRRSHALNVVEALRADAI